MLQRFLRKGREDSLRKDLIGLLTSSGKRSVGAIVNRCYADQCMLHLYGKLGAACRYLVF